MKVSKDRYLHVFGFVVIILALFRCAYPEVASHTSVSPSGETDTVSFSDTITTSDILQFGNPPVATAPAPSSSPDDCASSRFRNMPHPIYSVPHFQKSFPDSQSVHYASATHWGIKAVKNRHEAEKAKSGLVYIGANPYYDVDNLRQSIPYLVPRASCLLNDIGRNFFDSLYVKGIPLHKIIVTSALRTRDDISNLKMKNGNATENSCHLFGTTVDICYNRYTTVSPPGAAQRRAVRNDTLKWVLSEVLRDMRDNNRCHVKYEVKQGCFHITVR